MLYKGAELGKGAVSLGALAGSKGDTWLRHLGKAHRPDVHRAVTSSPSNFAFPTCKAKARGKRGGLLEEGKGGGGGGKNWAEAAAEDLLEADQLTAAEILLLSYCPNAGGSGNRSS